MKKIPVVSKQYLFPFIIITSLFALWGIANDLTNPMVSAFKKVMPELSNTQASLVQFAFYFGYFFMAMPAALFIRRFSYKAGIILGLSFYAVGAFLFYPAAQLESFEFYLISLWVITCGLAFLETTSNPLVLALGDQETATRRLNLAQAFNPIGSLTGMLMAQVLVIGTLRSSGYSPESYDLLSAADKAAIRVNDLGVISLPYIGLGVVVLAILVVVIVTKIPTTGEHQKMKLGDSFSLLFQNKRYVLGVVAQMFYVGAQIMCWTYIYQYVDHLNASLPSDEQVTATWYNMAAMIMFLAGRWIGTALMKRVVPAQLLHVFGIGGVVCLLVTILAGGMPGLFALVMTSMFMSIMFPTIYGIALKDMGDEAKIGSAGLVMAIVGGSFGPLLFGTILDMGGSGLADVDVLGWIPEVNFAFIVPLVCLAVVAMYGEISKEKNESK
ncbi:MFS transporter, FHS family, L-fucose permease [Reichenbachiella agariperforans]|uniref:MFS transporter, FHS family, L-fucose permease n=1 Tax=Reichenbachiella agariperforans TaxID=156994 RepID=A0A1M6UJC7_REIAG|nr:L-fucose:H+ symporter permease [Reichenbachiella agariperforans]SHK69276.1 MFS transporter, FHS family, L-fucose permease [Reichenbachiella agariperforans]